MKGWLQMGDEIKLESIKAYQELKKEAIFQIDSIKDSKVKAEVKDLVKLYTEKKDYVLSKDFSDLVKSASDNVNELEDTKEDNKKFSQFQKVLFNEITIWQTKTKPGLKKQIDDSDKKIDEIEKQIQEEKQKKEKKKKQNSDQSDEDIIQTLADVKKSLKQSKEDLKKSNMQVDNFKDLTTSLKLGSAAIGVVTMKTLKNALDNGKEGDKAGGILKSLLMVKEFLQAHSYKEKDGRMFLDINLKKRDTPEDKKEKKDKKKQYLAEAEELKKRLNDPEAQKGYEQSLAKIAGAANIGNISLPVINNIPAIRSAAEKYYNKTVGKIIGLKTATDKSPKAIWETVKAIKGAATTRVKSKLKKLYASCISANEDKEQRSIAKCMVAMLFSFCFVNKASAAGFALPFSETQSLFSGGGIAVETVLIIVVFSIICIAGAIGLGFVLYTIGSHAIEKLKEMFKKLDQEKEDAKTKRAAEEFDRKHHLS